MLSECVTDTEDLRKSMTFADNIPPKYEILNSRGRDSSEFGSHTGHESKIIG